MQVNWRTGNGSWFRVKIILTFAGDVKKNVHKKKNVKAAKRDLKVYSGRVTSRYLPKENNQLN